VEGSENSGQLSRHFDLIVFSAMQQLQGRANGVCAYALALTDSIHSHIEERVKNRLAHAHAFLDRSSPIPKFYLPLPDKVEQYL
jgi:hypothetical protein